MGGIILARGGGELTFEYPDEGFDAELEEIEGLADEIVAAAEAALGAVLEGVEAGKEDDGSGAVILKLTNVGTELEAGVVRHVYVQEDEVELVVAQDAEGHFGIVGTGNLEGDEFHGGADHLAGGRLVVDNEDIRRGGDP